MLLICPQCLQATPTPLKSVGFHCASCGQRREPLDGQFIGAYYGRLSEMEVSLRSDEGERFVLGELPAKIGRDSDFVSLQNNLAVSRCHCEVGFDEAANSFFVRDVSSAAGTHVEQVPVPPGQTLPIRPGQCLRLAGVALRLDVRLGQPAAPAADIQPGGQPIPLAALAGHGVLAIAPDGTIRAAPKCEPDATPLAVLHHAAGRETWRILALDRQAVRLNGELFIEQDLQPFDQVTLGKQSYLFDPSAAALAPDTLQAGPALEVRHVRVSVRGAMLLNDVNCRIPAGRMAAIIGQSGSGKTTLLKVLAGVMLPDAGEIFVNGQAMSWTACGAWAQQHLALVPQADVIHGELTVRECLEYAAALQRGLTATVAEKYERINKLLRDLGLLDHQHKRIEKLSGGQRKRVNVAVELLAASSVLLLDEPTTGLDYYNEHELVGRLQKLARQGRTVVFVTHSLASLELVDHVIFIHAEAAGGRILAEGNADAVRRRVQGGDWARFYDIPRAPDGRGQETPAETSLLGKAAVRVPRLAALTLRYYRIWLSSPVTFCAFLLGLPLVLGLLIRMAVSADGRLGTDRILFGLIAAFWLGMNQSVREIVRERDIFLREQNRGVSCLSFLLSKLAFFLVIALPQGLLMSLPIKWLAVEEFTIRFSLRELECPWLLLIVFFWLSDVLGCVVGLFLSSLCLFLRQKGEVAAVLLVILVTLPQFLFSAKTLPEGLTREPEHYHSFVLWHEAALLPELISYCTVSRYLFLPLDAVAHRMPSLARVFLFNLTIVVMFAACLMVATWLVLELQIRWHKRRA